MPHALARPPALARAEGAGGGGERKATVSDGAGTLAKRIIGTSFTLVLIATLD